MSGTQTLLAVRLVITDKFRMSARCHCVSLRQIWRWVFSFHAGRALGASLAVLLLLAAGCTNIGFQTMKARGVYTTLETPKFGPNASLDLPASGLIHQTSFKAGEVPVAIVAGYDEKHVTLELVELPGRRLLLSNEIHAGPGMFAGQTLDIARSGDYEVRVLLDGTQDDSFRFSVQRAEQTQPAPNAGATQVADVQAKYVVPPAQPRATVAQAEVQPRPEPEPEMKPQPERKLAALSPVQPTSVIVSAPPPVTKPVVEASITESAAASKGDNKAEDKVESGSPETAQQYFRRGVGRYHQGEYAMALSDFREAMGRDPGFVPACNKLAWVLATCPDDAIRNAKEAIQIALAACEQDGWKDGRLIDTFATAHADMGNFKHAVEYEKQALGAKGLTHDERAQMRRRLTLFKHQQPYRDKAD